MDNKIDILAIGVHPDDVELGCGATLAKMIAQGKKAGILDLTRGELGTRGSAEIREQEAAKAAKILGVKFRDNLTLADGFFENNKENQLKIIAILRKYQPELVLCNAPKDRHPDHGRASQLSIQACFLSGLSKIETELDGNLQEKWRPKKVYHYIQWQDLKPDFAIDVTGFLETKIKACLAYESQFFDRKSKEAETPITSKNFLDSISYRAQDLGRLIGTDAAEGFTSDSLLALDNFNSLLP